jgi:hypothetical protein
MNKKHKHNWEVLGVEPMLESVFYHCRVCDKIRHLKLVLSVELEMDEILNYYGKSTD